MKEDIRWYQRRSAVVIGVCVFVLLVVIWLWRAWVGMNEQNQVQFNAANAFKLALDTSSAESTRFQKVTSVPGNQTFLLPDYNDGSGIRNIQNLENQFVYNLNGSPSMPMFHVESIRIFPTTTMQYIVRIRYATWLGLSKIVTVSGNPPIPYKQ